MAARAPINACSFLSLLRSALRRRKMGAQSRSAEPPPDGSSDAYAEYEREDRGPIAAGPLKNGVA